MDSRKSLHGQFSKLHPSMPVTTRIGIIGAGPSGLAAAYALAKLGYSNVTVLEKHHTVAGMCESVDIGGTGSLNQYKHFVTEFSSQMLSRWLRSSCDDAGRVYDLGGQVIASNSAPTITHLAKEIGAEFEEMDAHKLALIDSQTGNYKDLEVADDYVSLISLTLKLQVRDTCTFGMRAS